MLYILKKVFSTKTKVPTINLYKYISNLNNMEITKEVVEHVAKVARIKLTEAEIQELTPQLLEILESFKILDEIEGEDICLHQKAIPENWREDEPHECLSQEQALSNVRFSKDGYIKGPRVQ